jgi:predicted DNA-binding protein (MmcQ/YjbR family)
MAGTPTARLRKICLALPEAVEQETWDTATFRVCNKIFAMVSEQDDRISAVFKAPPGSQAILIGADAERFYHPPYVGHKGWVGMWLDRKPDWEEVASLIGRSYRLTAPRRLVARPAE